jgi:hypothetical protein
MRDMTPAPETADDGEYDTAGNLICLPGASLEAASCVMVETSRAIGRTAFIVPPRPRPQLCRRGFSCAFIGCRIFDASCFGGIVPIKVAWE